MPDGRVNNGGKRPGQGRPPKADEEKARNLAVAAIESKHGSLEAGLQYLLDSEEPALIKFVYEHAIGKPREKLDLHSDAPLMPTFILNFDGEQGTR